MFIKMAWRNLWRRKRRTLITAFTVAGGIFFSVAFTATGDYAYTNMINTSAGMGYGHVTVQARGYGDTPTVQKRIFDSARIRDISLEADGVTNAAIRVTGQAMYSSAAKSVGGIFIGIDPAMETPEINLYLGAMVEGKMFTDTGGRGVVIGTRMAKKLNLRIGKKLVYTTTDINGEIVSEAGRVIGLFRTGVAEVDGSFALIPIDRIRGLLQYKPNEASLVAIFIGDQRAAVEKRDMIGQAINNDDIEILTWSETQADMAGMVALDRKFNHLSQFFIGLLIAAGVLNTIFMSVIERKREFGIMMAIGMGPFRLFGLIMAEAFCMAIVGLFMGVIITTPAYLYMVSTGLDLSSMIPEGHEVGGVLIDPVIKYRLYQESALAIITGVFTLSMLAGIYPAWRAVIEPPVESIKEI